jgi:protein SCO1
MRPNQINLLYMNILSVKGLFFSLILLLFIGLPTVVLYASDELGVYEKLDDYISAEHFFTDEDFNRLNLLEAIDKPTVIALVYYECPGICTPLLNGLAEVMKRSDLKLGEDYQVFVMSFSHRESPVLALNKKRTYEKLVGDGDTENGFRFFTGDSLTIDRFLDNVGYKIQAVGIDYTHPATLIVASPEGKITRYLHGTYFLPFDLKMAIIEAGMGRSGPTINKVLKFCFSYDPDGQRYVLNITKISGTIILLLALALLTGLIVSNKKRKPITNA